MLQFKDIKINGYFMYDQNKYKKLSSRTATLTEFNRVFYFKDKIKVTIVDYN